MASTVRRFGWPQGQYREVWIKQNLLPPMGYKLQNAQPAAGCHSIHALPAPPLTSPLYPKLIKINNLNLKKKILPTLQTLLVLKFYSCTLIQSKKGDRANEFCLLRMCQHGEPPHTATREYIYTHTQTHAHTHTNTLGRVQKFLALPTF